MSVRLKSAVLVLPRVLAACTSSTQFLQQIQPEAIASAERRRAFEMDCPTAKATLLSSQDIQVD